MIGIVTLVIGLIIGYLGQRSRFCIISGSETFIWLEMHAGLVAYLELRLAASSVSPSLNWPEETCQDFHYYLRV